MVIVGLLLKVLATEATGEATSLVRVDG